MGRRLEWSNSIMPLDFVITGTNTDPVSTSYEIDFDSNGLGIGHSLLDESIYMLDYFQDDVSGGAGNTVRQSIPGAPLNWNWDNSNNANDVDGRALLAAGQQDFLILTESVPFRHVQAPGYNEGTDTFASPLSIGAARETCDVRAWVDWHNLAAANGVTRVFVNQVWQDVRSGTASQGSIEDQNDPFNDQTWRARVDIDSGHAAEWVSLLRTGDHKALAYTASITSGTGVHLIPGGPCLAEVLDVMLAGNQPSGVTVTGTTFADFVAAFFVDDIHPSILGRYLIACAYYAVVFRSTPVGLPAQTFDIFGGNYGTLDADDALWMQNVAWQVCQANTLTGL